MKVLFARGTKQQKLTTMKILGLFERLPGFPEGANLLVNLQRQVELIPSTNATFFLARTTDPSAGTLHTAVAALRDGPGSADALQIDSRETALDKDQSSLAALNIRGLLTLDSAYALAMAATAITVYVFGLLLQRRREYVTMRALGCAGRTDPGPAGHRGGRGGGAGSGRRRAGRGGHGVLPGPGAAPALRAPARRRSFRSATSSP